MSSIRKSTLSKTLLISTTLLIAIGFLPKNSRTANPPKNRPVASSVENVLAGSVKQAPTTLAYKPSKAVESNPEKSKSKLPTLPEQIDQESFAIEQITYVDDGIIDEYWEEEADEEAYIEQKRQVYESMTEEELAVKEKIDAIENQLMMERDDSTQNVVISAQLAELLTRVDESNANSLVDLHCSAALCRIALELPDETAQYDAIDAITEQMDVYQQQAADVFVKPNDSRLVILYLVRAEIQAKLDAY